MSTSYEAQVCNGQGVTGRSNRRDNTYFYMGLALLVMDLAFVKRAVGRHRDNEAH